MVLVTRNLLETPKKVSIASASWPILAPSYSPPILAATRRERVRGEAIKIRPLVNIIVWLYKRMQIHFRRPMDDELEFLGRVQARFERFSWGFSRFGTAHKHSADSDRKA